MTYSWSYSVPSVAVAESVAGDDYSLTYEPDHAAVALGYLLEQYKGMPRMEAFLESIVGLMQPLEDLCWQLLRERYLEAIDGQGPAEGEQLDGLGIIVGEWRKGRSDTNYRRWIRVRGFINRSNGTIEDILSILDVLSSYLVSQFLECYPAHIEVYSQGSFSWTVWNEFYAIKQAKPAGVGLSYFYSTSTIATFRFSDTYSVEETDSNTGLGSEHTGIGGYLSGVITS